LIVCYFGSLSGGHACALRVYKSLHVETPFGGIRAAGRDKAAAFFVCSSARTNAEARLESSRALLLDFGSGGSALCGISARSFGHGFKVDDPMLTNFRGKQITGPRFVADNLLG
jgi:hypothetical protein